eukprot:SM000017S02842  [mRNA]  locus=s17:589822:591984:+ [translate_table: standard]
MEERSAEASAAPAGMSSSEEDRGHRRRRHRSAHDDGLVKRRRAKGGEDAAPAQEEQSPPAAARKRRREREKTSDGSGSEGSASGGSSSGSESSSEDEKRKKRKKDERRRRRREEKEERRRRRSKKEEDRSSGKKVKKADKHLKKDKEKLRLLGEAKKFLLGIIKFTRAAMSPLRCSRIVDGDHQAELSSKREPSLPSVDPTKIEKIAEDDYFIKNAEFSTWLKEGRGVYFSDLSSEQTHNLFQTFTTLWNSGHLPVKYYEGIEKAPHAAEEEDGKLAQRTFDKRERKKVQKEHNVSMDELLPKATGREALLEKKAIRREQSRARDVSPELMREKDLLGGGDDFQARLARERAWREKKASQKVEALQSKQADFRDKESAKMDIFKSMVNAAGGRIVIPKRANPG